MPDLDINGLPLASAVADGDLLIKWDSTQVSGQRTQKFTAAQFRAYIVNIIPVGPAGPTGSQGVPGPQGPPGKDGGGAGTVTSVALTTPADLTVSGSPVTSAGTLAITRNAQAANLVMAGPSSGANAVPTYRALVASDIPSLPYTTTAQAAAAAPVQSVAGRTGSVTLAVADVAGAAPLASPTFSGTPTVPTATVGTNTTQAASTAFVLANGSASGGFPSAFATKSANYTVVTTDKNTLFTLTGSFTLSLPSAASFGANNGIYLSKTDGSGVWAVTPASGTVDGLPSINVYQERFSLVSDGTNWRSINRQKGFVSIGTTTISSAVVSLTFTTGFNDPELRDMQFTADNIALAASDFFNIRVQKSGTFQTSGYQIQFLSGTASAAGASSSSAPSAGAQNVAATSQISASIIIHQFGSSSPQRIENTTYTISPSSIGILQGAQNTVSAPITAVLFYTASASNITGGVISQSGFRQ